MVNLVSNVTNGCYDCLILAYRSNGDGDLSIVDEPANDEMLFESLDPFNQRIFIDNRIGIQLPIQNEVNNSLMLLCQARRVGASTSPPDVTWTVNGKIVSTSSCTNCFSSSLNISSFSASDAGVYQCIFTDTDSAREVVTGIPFRLDTGLCNVYRYHDMLFIFLNICLHAWDRYFCRTVWKANQYTLS